MLELDKTEQRLMRNFVGSIRSGGVQRGIESIIEYVMDLEENREIKHRRKEILEQAKEAASGQHSEKALMESIIILNQNNVQVPLKISLTGKNLQSLHRLVERAGFEGVTDAFKLTARPMELLKFAMMR